MKNLRYLPGGLLVLSSITHVVQLFVYPGEASAIGASVVGLIYLAIGILILIDRRLGLILGIILPAIGGMLGIIRFFTVHRNPFSPFHVAIDLIVIASCFYLLQKHQESEEQA